MFDFRLQVFHTVAKRLSFTKAASDLFITQPAVSKHIQELEQQFRVQLFERQGNKIKLTPQGKVMLHYTEQLMSTYRQMEFDLNSFSDAHKGTLHLGASTTISQYVIPSALPQFHNQYRDVNIKLLNGNTEQIEAALIDKNIDLGIIEGKSRNRGIRYSEFLKDEIVLVSNINHPLAAKGVITFTELKDIPLLQREAGSGTLDVIAHALKSKGISMSQLLFEMELGSTEAIKNYVRHSECMAFLSVHSIVTELTNKEFAIIDVEDLTIDRYFYFIERQGSSEPLAELFMNFARSVIT